MSKNKQIEQTATNPIQLQRNWVAVTEMLARTPERQARTVLELLMSSGRAPRGHASADLQRQSGTRTEADRIEDGEQLRS